MSIGPKRAAGKLLKCAATGLAAAAAVSCQHASPDWNGTWKLDPVRSDFPAPTITVSMTQDGIYQVATVKFRCDGKGYQAKDTTIFCAQKNSLDLEITHFRNGSKIRAVDWQLSSDGNALTIESTDIQADGSAKSKEHRYTRTSGSTGFVGGWRNVNPLDGVRSIRQIKLQGNLLHEFFPEDADYADAWLDGTDAPFHGPNVSPGWSIALRGRNPREFGLTMKRDRRVVSVGYWRISDDGHSMTESYWAPTAPNQKAVAVFEKQ